MFFRFGSAVVLVVLVSLAATALEKQNLELRRRISRQHFRTDVLLEKHARLRLKSQRLGAPTRVIRALEEGRLKLREPEESVRGGQADATEPSDSSGRPLLRWQRPTPFGR